MGSRREAYTGEDFWETSPDGNYLAYAADFTGYREYRVRVLELRAAEYS